MKNISLIIAITVVLISTSLTSIAQENPLLRVNRKDVIDSLTTLDPNIQKYFPRWKVCEPDLIFQLYNSFLYQGFDPEILSPQDIEILAAPKEFDADPYDLLLITCGQATLNTVDIETKLTDILIGFLSGAIHYSGVERGYQTEDGKRDYCFTDIPPDIPFSVSQAQTVIDYLQPTNVDHAFTLSLFEQSVKVGESGFWLRSTLGNDQVGYQFWSAGENKISLQRPLYINRDYGTQRGIPYLINVQLGGVYRINSGINNDNTLMGWVKSRALNGGPGGKIAAAFDFHMPFQPEVGISVNMELPFEGLTTRAIDQTTYAMTEVREDVDFVLGDARSAYRIDGIVPVLRSTGQVTLFYNWWLNKQRPENFFRFHFGISYAEVREYARYRDTDQLKTFISNEQIEGIKTYKPNQPADWMYFKAEYRNQDVYPFGASVQISNQIFLGRIYLPLFGNWFYLEGKYSTPMRDAHPYEIKNFFMISPVLRLTI